MNRGKIEGLTNLGGVRRMFAKPGKQLWILGDVHVGVDPAATTVPMVGVDMLNNSELSVGASGASLSVPILQEVTLRNT